MPITPCGLLSATVLQVETAQANPEVTEAEQFRTGQPSLFSRTTADPIVRPDRRGDSGVTKLRTTSLRLVRDDCTGVFTFWRPMD